MLLKYFYDPHLAQASYLLACPGSGEALIIDPARTIDPYLEAASARGLRIVGVAETHIHADYVSGGHELAAATHATLYLSSHGGAYGYRFAADGVRVQPVSDGERIELGGIQVEVLHTPGHTPEHIAYLVTAAGAGQPVGLFSGDFLFVGDVGRPDLLEKAVGVKDTKVQGAHEQFASVQRARDLPDFLQIWPGHGAGSACGKALGEVPSSVLGYERLYNPAFQFTDAASFTDWLLADQPPAPRYFGQMKAINQRGATLLASLEAPQVVSDPKTIRTLVDTALVIDTRERAAFAEGHIPGTVNIPASSQQFTTYAGWYVHYDRPTYLIADRATLPDVLARLRAIGVDAVPAVISPDIASAHTGTLEQLTPQQAQHRQADGALILDVRAASERAERHIPNSQHVPMGEVLGVLSSLPPDRDIITQCGSGLRSQVVASLLKRHGFKRVANLDGGISAWAEAGLPLT